MVAIAVDQVVEPVRCKHGAVRSAHKTVAVDAVGVVAAVSGILGAEQGDGSVAVYGEFRTEFLIFTAFPGTDIRIKVGFCGSREHGDH